MSDIDVTQLGISEICQVLETEAVTSVDLVCAYLNRIAYFDRTGLCLNAVPVLNPACLEEAAASDERRRAGQAGPLEGVPFTVKDSYMVAGLTVASGSPALKDLIANSDAATVEQLREAGAVLLGKTNMPPMAAGGVQPGAYGYTRSPYNPQYLTAAYGSGSSLGSGTGTAASFAAFSMAEETVSSGRSPASNNALVAYTPSRGVLSIRGNWPLRPTCDVVVPYTQSVSDMLRLLDVLAVEDTETTGDFWRQQNAVELPTPQEVLPAGISLRSRPKRLDGLRFGVPKMYIGEDDQLLDAPVIRPAVKALWHRAAQDLRNLGAEVVAVDFPVVSHYEQDRPGAEGLPERGLVPQTWREIEGGTITAMALDQFLQQNADPELNTWADIDGDQVFPADDAPVYVWVTRARGGFDWQRLAEIVKTGLPSSYDQVPDIGHLLRGLEEARRHDFEDWLRAEGLDAVAFPAAGDVGRDDLFTRPESLEHASQNGVVYSHGNRVIRHLGIPTVTVPMGCMADIQMPVGLTFAGPAYGDDALFDYAFAYEQATQRRQKAFLTPSLPSGVVSPTVEPASNSSSSRGPLSDRPSEIPSGSQAGRSSFPNNSLSIETVSITGHEAFWEITVRLNTAHAAEVWADGHILLPTPDAQSHQEKQGSDDHGSDDHGSLAVTYCGKVSRSRPRLDQEVFILAKQDGRAAMAFEPLPGH